jgi:hypothetical protein
MTKSVDTLAFEQALMHAGLSLERLSKGSFAVALFGSRADACWHSRSDWDVLCVGPLTEPQPTSRRAPVDLIQLSPDEVHLPTWLHGDLAGHILEYGVWVVGEPTWGPPDVCYPAAVERKEKRLALRVRAVARVWEALSSRYRKKQALLLRRELQRLSMLQSHCPVPPSARLDTIWAGFGQSVGHLHAVLRRLSTPAELIAATLHHAD